MTTTELYAYLERQGTVDHVTPSVENEVKFAFHTTTAHVGNLTCIPYSPLEVK